MAHPDSNDRSHAREGSMTDVEDILARIERLAKVSYSDTKAWSASVREVQGLRRSLVASGMNRVELNERWSLAQQELLERRPGAPGAAGKNAEPSSVGKEPPAPGRTGATPPPPEKIAPPLREPKASTVATPEPARPASLPSPPPQAPPPQAAPAAPPALPPGFVLLGRPGVPAAGKTKAAPRVQPQPAAPAPARVVAPSPSPAPERMPAHATHDVSENIRLRTLAIRAVESIIASPDPRAQKPTVDRLRELWVRIGDCGEVQDIMQRRFDELCDAFYAAL